MAAIIYTPPATPPTPPTPPGGLTGNVQYNNAGAFGGLRFLEADANAHHQQFIAALTQPAQPPTDRAILYASNDDGDNSLNVLNSFNKDFPIQLGIGHKIVGMMWPGAGTTVTGSFAWNGYVNSATGNWQATNPLGVKSYSAATTLPNISRMIGATTAAVNSAAECYVNTLNRAVIPGNGLQAWGTKLILTFGLPTYATTQRIFAGYTQYGSALGSGVDPSSYLNSIAIIKDASDNTFNFFFRGALGSTKINTGVTPAANGLYRATIFIPSVGTTAYMNFQEIGVNAITANASVSNSSTIPAVGFQFLYPHLYVSTGAAATIANIALIQVYEEQL